MCDDGEDLIERRRTLEMWRKLAYTIINKRHSYRVCISSRGQSRFIYICVRNNKKFGFW